MSLGEEEVVIYTWSVWWDVSPLYVGYKLGQMKIMPGTTSVFIVMYTGKYCIQEVYIGEDLCHVQLSYNYKCPNMPSSDSWYRLSQ